MTDACPSPCSARWPGCAGDPRRRGAGPGRRVRPAARRARPPWRRVELRYVDLKAGRHLQVTAYDDTQAHTVQPRARRRRARGAVDDLLDEPFGNWHVDTTTETHQLRVTKKGEARACTPAPAADAGRAPTASHDRDKGRLLPEDDPVFRALGLSDHAGPDEAEPAGEVPPGRGVPADPRRRRSTDALDKGHLRTPDRRASRCGSSTSAAATPT